jgi:hypothetical protein
MPEKATSFLLIEEYFSREDDRFLPALRDAGWQGESKATIKRLAAFADRWKTDPRPWARRQILDYLGLPLNAPLHQPVVKRLFKECEKRGDDALMGAFLVAFDTLIRRVRKTRWKWDYQARAAAEVEEWVVRRNTMPTSLHISWKPKLDRRGARLFSYRTRSYLRRRAWRYFRKIGALAIGGDGRIDGPKAQKYLAAVTALLARYTDDDLKTGENILDSWCLLQICFRGSPVLRFTPHHAHLVEGRSLGELAAAPRFPALWKTLAGAEALLTFLSTANARLVRVWARQLLAREHAAFLRDLAPARLFALLESEDEEVQQFAAELLKNLSGLEELPITDWLRLLDTKNELALETLVAALREKVAPERFSIEQLVDLATRRPAAVARLGLDFLKPCAFTTPTELDLAARLSQARSPAVAGAIARFGLSVVAAPSIYNVDRVAPFFDALEKSVRTAAWEIMAPGTPAYDDPALWARLMESPYDDIRLALVDRLETRRDSAPPPALTRAGPAALAAIWTAVLLNIHRGGRQKLRALHQISRELLAHSAHADTLLPIMAVAIRSVRVPEARVGLAALVTVMARRPELAPLIERHLPEMKLLPTLETAGDRGGL